MVEPTPLKNISQIGSSSPNLGLKIKNIWSFTTQKPCRGAQKIGVSSTCIVPLGGPNCKFSTASKASCLNAASRRSLSWSHVETFLEGWFWFTGNPSWSQMDSNGRSDVSRKIWKKYPCIILILRFIISIRPLFWISHRPHMSPGCMWFLRLGCCWNLVRLASPGYAF